MEDLVGARTRLRAWRADDAAAVYAACQDPEIQRFTTVPSPYHRSDAEDFLARRVHEAAAAFAVEALDGAGVVASIALLHVREGVGEIGYWCAPWARGRGYVGDALAVVVDRAFTRRDVDALELVIEPANTASWAVARRAGFVEERAAGPDQPHGARVHVLRREGSR